MENCTFNEKFSDWLKKVWNWSPVNKDTIGTYPGQYVDAQGNPIPQAKEIPTATPVAQPIPMAQPVQRQAAKAMGQWGPQGRQAVDTRVKFNRQLLIQLMSSVDNHLSLLDQFANRVSQQTRNPQSQEYITSSYQKQVGPYANKLRHWVGWAKDLINQLPTREWGEDEELILEAIKVGYKNFENAMKAIQDVTSAMRNWVGNLAKVPELKSNMDRIQSVFDRKVADKSLPLVQSFRSMGEKVKELMNKRGMQYDDLSGRPGPAQVNAPYGDEGDYGSKLAGQMQRDQSRAQAAKDAGMGVSMLSRGQQSSVPLSPVGSTKGSGIFNRWLQGRG
jgi:hypothetical protein